MENKKIQIFPPIGKTYVVVIAVSDYESKDTGYGNLDYCVPQAKNLSEYFKKQGYEVREFFNEKATKDNLEKYLYDELERKIDKNRDRLLF